MAVRREATIDDAPGTTGRRVSAGQDVTFERLADLASYGQGVIEAHVCGVCGAMVVRRQQDTHRRWHRALENAGYPDVPVRPSP